MLIDGVLKYFKSLSVGSGVESTVHSLFSGFAKKTTLIYAKDLALDSNKTLEIDATIDFSITMETKLLDTPAENQVVYTAGALRQPRIITIKCYLELDKLTQLKEIYDNTIPVWVVCEKPIPSTINQKGYYADSSLYAVQSMTVVNEGYYNCVACTLTLREIQVFTYQSESLYDKSKNKINKASTNKQQTVGVIRSKGFTIGTLFDSKLWSYKLGLKKTFEHNLQGSL